MTILEFAECSICFGKIDSKLNVYKPKFSVGQVCDICYASFDDNEKEILIHVFNVARSAFGVENYNILRVKDALYDVQNELKQKKEHLTPNSVFLAILERSRAYYLNLNLLIISNIKCQKPNSEQSFCIICNRYLRNKLKDHSLDQKSEFKCKHCLQEFSNEEIQIMASLFRRYGGFFGKLKAEKIEIRQIATDLTEKLKRAKDLSLLFEINEVALHRALLHGYNPKDFIEELKKI